MCARNQYIRLNGQTKVTERTTRDIKKENVFLL